MKAVFSMKHKAIFFLFKVHPNLNLVFLNIYIFIIIFILM